MAIAVDWGRVPDFGERPDGRYTRCAARGRVETCRVKVTDVGTAAEDGEGAVGCAGVGCSAGDPSSSVRTRSINLYRGGGKALLEIWDCTQTQSVTDPSSNNEREAY